MELTTLQIVGYVASGIIALSMTMNSIVKFRWINLVGATTFATYGYLLGALPVGLLNTFIVSVDIFYLLRIYTKKEIFETLEVRGDNKYLLRFLEFYDKDIQKQFPGFVYKPEMNTVSFFILRNMMVAGLFLAHRKDGNILNVGLDYVIPQYRDYKNGKYIYHRLRDKFKADGFETIMFSGEISPQHEKYLKKLDFKDSQKRVYVKKIN